MPKFLLAACLIMYLVTTTVLGAVAFAASFDMPNKDAPAWISAFIIFNIAAFSWPFANALKHSETDDKYSGTTGD